MRKFLYICIFVLSSFTFVSCAQNNQETASKTSNNQAIGPELTKFLEASSKPAAIKFYAEWCSSCERYAPTFAAVKAELADQADFYEVDIDQSQFKLLTKELKISRIPMTVFVSQDRQNLSKKLGALTKDSLTNKVKHLANI